MDRVIVYFLNEETQFINIEATDIFQQGEYFHIYNNQDLVAILLASVVKIIYKSKKRDANG